MYRAYDNWSWSNGKRDEDLREAPPQAPCATARNPSPKDWQVLVHPLVFCPELAKGTRYLLVRRAWPGQRDILAVGRAKSRHESINLARVRQTAATLGANEVHVLSA